MKQLIDNKFAILQLDGSLDQLKDKSKETIRILVKEIADFQKKSQIQYIDPYQMAYIIQFADDEEDYKVALFKKYLQEEFLTTE